MTEEEFEKLLEKSSVGKEAPDDLPDVVLTRIRLHYEIQELIQELEPYVTGCEVETRGLRDRLVAELRSPGTADHCSRMSSLLFNALQGDGHDNPMLPGQPDMAARIEAQYPGVTARLDGGLVAPWVIRAEGEKAVENLIRYLRTGIERTPVPDRAREADNYEFLKEAVELVEEGRTEDVQAMIEARKWATEDE